MISHLVIVSVLTVLHTPLAASQITYNQAKGLTAIQNKPQVIIPQAEMGLLIIPLATATRLAHLREIKDDILPSFEHHILGRKNQAIRHHVTMLQSKLKQIIEKWDTWMHILTAQKPKGKSKRFLEFVLSGFALGVGAYNAIRIASLDRSQADIKKRLEEISVQVHHNDETITKIFGILERRDALFQRRLYQLEVQDEVLDIVMQSEEIINDNLYFINQLNELLRNRLPINFVSTITIKNAFQILKDKLRLQHMEVVFPTFETIFQMPVHTVITPDNDLEVTVSIPIKPMAQVPMKWIHISEGLVHHDNVTRRLQVNQDIAINPKNGEFVELNYDTLNQCIQFGRTWVCFGKIARHDPEDSCPMAIYHQMDLKPCLPYLSETDPNKVHIVNLHNNSFAIAVSTPMRVFATCNDVQHPIKLQGLTKIQLENNCIMGIGTTTVQTKATIHHQIAAIPIIDETPDLRWDALKHSLINKAKTWDDDKFNELNLQVKSLTQLNAEQKAKVVKGHRYMLYAISALSVGLLVSNIVMCCKCCKRSKSKISRKDTANPVPLQSPQIIWASSPSISHSPPLLMQDERVRPPLPENPPRPLTHVPGQRALMHDRRHRALTHEGRV